MAARLGTHRPFLSLPAALRRIVYTTIAHSLLVAVWHMLAPARPTSTPAASKVRRTGRSCSAPPQPDADGLREAAGKFYGPYDVCWKSFMSSVSAHQDLVHPVLSAPELRVAMVPADADGYEVSRSIPNSIRLDGIVALVWCGIDDVVAERPDVVILAADFSAGTGLAALRRIRKEASGTPVVVVARCETSARAARQALNAGAEAFVRADEVGQALAPALHAVMAGLVCAPREVRRLVAKPTFSHREKEVLELLVAGLTNNQIAARLYLAESTVKSHVASVFAKLGVRSRKDAVALLLDPAEGLMATALPPRAPSAPDSPG